MSLEPPSGPVAFGPFLITRRIARGGMAEIYRAWTPDGGWVALKLMRPALGHDGLRLSLFEREARITTRLDHPNVVPVHAFGEEEGRPYLAMEYVRGRDLGHLLANPAKGRPGPAVVLALWLGAEAARGLGHAHRLRDPSGHHLEIVHRDVSPGNVMLAYDGGVRVVDFGVARINEAAASVQTQTGTLRGKFAYMSPEQTRGEPLDARSDVFSLGTVLYELITGAHCFRDRDPLATLDRVQSLRPAPPTHVREGIPRAVDEILARCLAKEPERRFADGVELAEALDSLFATQPFDGRAAAVAHMQALFGEKIREEEAMLEAEQAELRAASGARAFVADDRAIDDREVRVSTHEEANVTDVPSSRPGADDTEVFGSGMLEEATEAVRAAPLFDAPMAPGAVQSVSSLLGATEENPPISPPALATRRWWRRPAFLAAGVGLGLVVVAATVPRGALLTLLGRRAQRAGPGAEGPIRTAPVTIEISSLPAGARPPPQTPIPEELPAGDAPEMRRPKPAPAKVTRKKRRRRRSARPRRKAPVRRRASKAKTGFLNVGAQPWAHIVIDGKKWPHPTPQAGIELPAGLHSIELSNPETGQKERRRIRIAPGGYRTVVADLREH